MAEGQRLLTRPRQGRGVARPSRPRAGDHGAQRLPGLIGGLVPATGEDRGWRRDRTLRRSCEAHPVRPAERSAAGVVSAWAWRPSFSGVIAAMGSNLALSADRRPVGR
jgi:hypothetical protein